MPATNANAVISAEMERVTPLVDYLYDKDDTFFSTIDKDANIERISDRDMRIPIRMRPGGKFGQFNPDGGDLGRGSGPQYDKATINTYSFKYACEITSRARWATDDARKSVVDAFKDIVAQSMPEFRRYSDALCMTSGNGVLATVSAVSTASGVDTVTLDTDGFGAMLLRDNQSVDVYDSTLATNRSAGATPEITYYDLANKQVKLTPATSGITAGDVLVLSGIGYASPQSLLGVPYHNNSASTGTWLGLDRATFPQIRSSRVNALSGALALPMARLAMNKLKFRLGLDKRQKLIAWTNPAQTSAYEELGQLVQIIQKQPTDEALDLYFGEGLQLAGAPMRETIHWDMKRIDFIIPSMWGRAEMHPAGFYTDVNGDKMFPLRGPSGGVASADIFYLVASWNLFMRNPSAAAYIDNLAVPAGY